jgi:Kef-type K+ transport system membrane component KefB
LQSSVHQTENLLFATLLQLIVMIGAARLVHTVFRRLNQPGVIGEIVAGLLLGPSLFGHFFPGLSQSLFGARASSPITMISQIGLILLMFQIGTEFEFGHLTAPRNRRAAVLVTIVSVCVPLATGFMLGRWSAPSLAAGIDPLSYSLFFSLGLAITAVPILGRILRQYGLTQSEVGVVAISAAAINDVIGWLLLSAVSDRTTGQLTVGAVLLQWGGLAALAAALWFLARPAIARLLVRLPVARGVLSPNLMAVVVCIVFVLGACTYRLGIFAIFGGFVAGVLFHREAAFVAAWRRQVGDFVMVFFLPVFFTFTGLRTNLLGLTAATDWEWLVIILGAAIGSKVIPVYWAGRLAGFGREESAMLATLMNTRALMELIVLNIGFDLGLIPANVFTMLVIMAVVTTLMAGPLLTWLMTRSGRTIPTGVEA